MRATKQASGLWSVSFTLLEHTNCAGTCKPSSATMAGIVSSQIRANKSIKSTELQATLQAAGIEGSRRTVNNAKLQVKASMAMGNNESYELLPPFLKAFKVCAV